MVVDLGIGAVVLGIAAGGLGAELPWVLLLAAVTSSALLRRRPRVLRTAPALLDDLVDVVVAVAAGIFATLALRTLIDPTPGSAYALAYLALVLAAALAAGRVGVELAHRHVIARGRGRLQTLVVGDEPVGRLLAARLLQSPTIGLNPIGVLSELSAAAITTAEHDRLPRLGSISALATVLRDRTVEHVVAVTDDQARLNAIVEACHAAAVDVSVGTPSQIGLRRSRPVERLSGVALLHVDRPGPHRGQLAIKYGFDRLVAALLLSLMLPLLLVIAAVVLVESRGPVIFRQRRVGVNGETFEMLKFRTMVGSPEDEGEADVGWAIHELSDNPFSVANETPLDRVTRVGHWLRRFSLDELPQLINVLRGDMSLIGPRPERSDYVCLFEEHVEHYGDRHRVKPGITGWAQVNGLRGRTSLRERTAYDNDYIAYWSPWLDLKIACLTLPAMLNGQHAE
jgi:exopolysaccharide biosynthesis polyprenyl glycosylphosphotransferase